MKSKTGISPKPEEFTPIDETVSTTGKYALAFGKHFRPMICFDVVVVNRATGHAKRVHHADNEAGARAMWDEFKKAMTGKRLESEQEEKDVYRFISPSRKPNCSAV